MMCGYLTDIWLVLVMNFISGQMRGQPLLPQFCSLAADVSRCPGAGAVLLLTLLLLLLWMEHQRSAAGPRALRPFAPFCPWLLSSPNR